MSNKLNNQINLLNQKASFEYQQATKHTVRTIENFIKEMTELKNKVEVRIEDGRNLDKVYNMMIQEATSNFSYFIKSLETSQQYASDLQQTNAQLEVLRDIANDNNLID